VSHDRLCRQHKYIHADFSKRLKDEANGGLKLGCGASSNAVYALPTC
jgi:hypothetical protein